MIVYNYKISTMNDIGYDNANGSQGATGKGPTQFEQLG